MTIGRRTWVGEGQQSYLGVTARSYGALSVNLKS